MSGDVRDTERGISGCAASEHRAVKHLLRPGLTTPASIQRQSTPALKQGRPGAIRIPRAAITIDAAGRLRRRFAPARVARVPRSAARDPSPGERRPRIRVASIDWDYCETPQAWCRAPADVFACRRRNPEGAQSAGSASTSSCVIRVVRISLAGACRDRPSLKPARSRCARERARKRWAPSRRANDDGRRPVP